MANTNISDIANRILRNPADAGVEVVEGKLASTYKPGQIVYESALGVWTVQATNAGQTQRSGVVGDQNRKYNGTTKGIDTAYAANDIAQIILRGKVACFITDQGGAKLRGQLFTLSSTAGSLTAQSDGTLRNVGCLDQAIADDDTVALMDFDGRK